MKTLITIILFVLLMFNAEAGPERRARREARKHPKTQKEQSNAMAREARNFQLKNFTKENHKIITVFLVGVICVLHVKGYVE